MSSVVGTALLAAALAGGIADVEKPALPRPILQAALKKAGCSLPADKADVVGTEHLSRRLQIVEVACWNNATNSGSILFAVPERRPAHAQLIAVESWHDGQIRQSYSVSSPAFDAATRTLSSTHKAREAGDCGVIQEMKWTGWHFRLLNVWRKDRCDGTPFEWESREQWQVFPQHAGKPDDAAPPMEDGGAQQAQR